MGWFFLFCYFIFFSLRKMEQTSTGYAQKDRGEHVKTGKAGTINIRIKCLACTSKVLCLCLPLNLERFLLLFHSSFPVPAQAGAGPELVTNRLWELAAQRRAAPQARHAPALRGMRLRRTRSAAAARSLCHRSLFTALSPCRSITIQIYYYTAPSD